MQERSHKRMSDLQPQKIDMLVDDYIDQHFPHLQKRNSIATIFIFMDGVGIGDEKDSTNPLYVFGRELFRELNPREIMSIWGNGMMVPTDPLLHTPGLPQSATGQTALFTGIDAVKAAGRHVPALPTTTLRQILARESIFLRLVQQQKRPCFANAYSDSFFEGRRRFHSSSTLSYFASGLPFRGVADANAGKAIFMDITHRLARRMGMAVGKNSIEQSARTILGLAYHHDFVMFEYFLTDKAGHAMRSGLSRRAIELLESFLVALVRQADLSQVQIIVSSDHGNIEQITDHVHTRNKVPTFLWGPYTETLAPQIFDLVDVHRAMCQSLSISFPQRE